MQNDKVQNDNFGIENYFSLKETSSWLFSSYYIPITLNYELIFHQTVSCILSTC
jgi:hypothetical protein